MVIVRRFTDAKTEKGMRYNKIKLFTNMKFERKCNIFYKLISISCIIPIFLLCIIGCSDVPYSGPVLTVDSVDRYLESAGGDTICLQDGFDSICLKTLEDEDQDAPPIVHIHPSSVVFMFLYEDRRVLRAEKVMDTTELIQDLVDAGQVQLPANEDASDQEEIDTSGEWIIDIYYPRAFLRKIVV